MTIPDVHYFSNGVYANRMDFLEAGAIGIQHKHIYDHLSILASGSVKLEVDGIVTTHKAPAAITIQAGKIHQITALESNTTWFCIHGIPEGLRGSEPTKSSIESSLIQETLE